MATQAGGDRAIDADQAVELVRQRLSHDLERLAHDEDAEIGDVLADRLGEGIVLLGHRGEKHAPDLAVERQRTVEIGDLRVPVIPDPCELAGAAGEQVGFEFAGTRCFLRRLLVRQRRLLLHV